MLNVISDGQAPKPGKPQLSKIIILALINLIKIKYRYKININENKK